jgi:quercetin dioxygenase-like cupin family protein
MSGDAEEVARGSARESVRCADLDAALAHYSQRGYRLDMIMPADAPRTAIVSRGGASVHLTTDDVGLVALHPDSGEDLAQGLVITRTGDAWTRGRAGMEYRDLVPGRLGGRVIASHIRIPDGGPAPDSVHYHKVQFQMIYCRRGSVRVVYEDQGPPFVMHEGDCVLQPPTIRHRVLESSPGLEVIEVASPAEHETWHDHELVLPTSELRPDRLYEGQRFVRHVGANARWQRVDGVAYRDLGLGEATSELATGRVLRLAAGERIQTHKQKDEVQFVAILSGSVSLSKQDGRPQILEAGDACTVVSGRYEIESPSSAEILEVVLRER